FQAEDGIRDFHVTGVQTCALPICAVEQQVFVNEVTRAEVPFPLVTLQTVGPALQRHGSEELKREFLPGILAGEVHFAIGYSEPEIGRASCRAGVETTGAAE